MNEKIEEILKRNLSSAKTFELSMTGIYEELSTLIQQEREEAYNEGYEEGKLLDTKVYVGIEPMKKIQEEAVRGFAEWLNAHDFLFRDGLMMKMYEQYLSQQREKGKE